MKPDRMAAYEAPRVPDCGRPTMTIRLLRRGHRQDKMNTVKVDIARQSPMPDLLSYEGRFFVHRRDGVYVEANVWPIIEELDGV